MNSNDNSRSNTQDFSTADKITRLLCFGDSNTWGFDPGSGRRLDGAWPNLLQAAWPTLEVVTDAMPGRTSYYDSPDLGFSSGAEPFSAHSSNQTFLILMLGTNDLCTEFGLSVEQITNNLKELLSGWPPQQLLLIAPPPFAQLAPHWLRYFAGRERESQQLSANLEQLASQIGYHFMDAAKYCSCGIDGLHLDTKGHQQLAQAILAEVDANYGLEILTS